MAMLRDNTGWRVDIKTKWLDIQEFTGGKPEENMMHALSRPGVEEKVRAIGQAYDIIYTSYIKEPWAYALLQFIEQQYGVKHVMDVDDDLFNVSDWNPAKNVLESAPHKSFGKRLRNLDVLRQTIKSASYLTTTTKPLAQKYRRVRDDRESVQIIPNYPALWFYSHPGPVNDGKVRIGWQGSIHHQGDIENTGFLPALKRILQKYENVEFHVAGYLPKDLPSAKTFVYETAGNMMEWQALFKLLRFDISCAPLEDSKFNQGKSPIKWMEGSLMGAATVASQAYPYRFTIQDGEDGLLAENTEKSWYEKLELLVKNTQKRKDLAARAKARVETQYALERNWTEYRDFFKEVVK